MDWQYSGAANWLFGPGPTGDKGHLNARWLFLRALGLIYFSAFYPLLFQVRGLIGPDGILPARTYLQTVAQYMGAGRYWFAPTLYWIRSSDAALMAFCWLGLIASVAVVLNLWPRMSLFICLVAYLSFVAAAQDFSGYQSDGMLLEAGFIALFFAPPGLRPGRGEAHPPSRASLFLLQWEWFRIYFESGLVKLLSGDVEWRHLTAMDEYYQNGPLPTWIGWYVQHMPHRFHVGTAFATLAMELVVVWLMFFPRRWRIACFAIVTPWEYAVILTANYTFLNYLVLSLGVLLLDDRFLEPLRQRVRARFKFGEIAAQSIVMNEGPESAAPDAAPVMTAEPPAWRAPLQTLRLVFAGFCLIAIFYSTSEQLVHIVFPLSPLPNAITRILEPFRIANSYGLFAVMTRGRYEIEFQGSNDGGKTWTPYQFRYKPQATNEPPGIYAPYQPRLDWNLWFASLGNWREYTFVPLTEERLLKGSRSVLKLFKGNPFPEGPPERVRSVIWQYWFTDMETKRKTGNWWRREFLGEYAPTLEREADGSIAVVSVPRPPLMQTNPPDEGQP